MWMKPKQYKTFSIVDFARAHIFGWWCCWLCKVVIQWWRWWCCLLSGYILYYTINTATIYPLFTYSILFFFFFFSFLNYSIYEAAHQKVFVQIYDFRRYTLNLKKINQYAIGSHTTFNALSCSHPSYSMQIVQIYGNNMNW